MPWNFTIVSCELRLMCKASNKDNLNVMHVEQNIYDNLFKCLFGEKDTMDTKHDMEEVGIYPWLCLQRRACSFMRLVTPYVFKVNKN